MSSLIARLARGALALLLLPSAVYAQAAIAGVVRDTSGAVLPGVTVEAASPALIEKVRSVVSDTTGQYRIVDLRPGSYSVTFTLTGFSTVRRTGIELSGDFVATVNADLKVGALEETITVTGETPIVDVQSAKVQQTVSKDVLGAIPSSRSVAGLQAVIPGLSGSSDSGLAGGSGGGNSAGSTGTIHGGRVDDSRTQQDGLDIGWAGGNSGNASANVSGAHEVVLTTSGGMGEADTAGVVLNVIPREGSNTFSGTLAVSGANGAMQGSNYTQTLRDQGLRTPSELLKVYDINPMGGGRIIRDKVWFYLSFREWGADTTVPGMWVNRNAGNPNAWSVDFDLSRQAFNDFRAREGVGRITWQATPRNKINLHWHEHYHRNNARGGGTSTQTIEATGVHLQHPSHVQQATWSSPISSRVLLEAGWSSYQARYRQNAAPRTDGTHNPLMIRVQEQRGSIPGLRFRMPAGTGGGFQHNLIGTLANTRASVSYVTGTHNVKVGYQGAYNAPTQNFYYFSNVILYRFNNGVPNQLTQNIAYPSPVKYVRNLVSTHFYGQDQWTIGRLTLQGGVRYEHVFTSYPDSRVGGPGYSFAPVEISYPKGSTDGIRWDDVTPRMGAAYDLFGNGKTGVKFNVGKYLQAFAARSGSDLDLNPLIRTTISTTRSWTDTNKDFVPNCDLSNPKKNGECADLADQNLGKEKFTRTFDPNFVTGFGSRPYTWSLGMSIQQEIVPRVSVNVAYNRNWWGNWYVVDNRATTLADYTPFSIVAPVDPRLPGGGGHTISGLYDLVPGKVGLVDELAQSASNFADQTENWQGVDVSVVARLRYGLTIQGGTSTGRRLTDSCAVRAKLPELGSGPTGFLNSSITSSSVTNPYCRVVEPYVTSIRGLALYIIPRVDVQVSGTWQSDPGPSLEANYVVRNADVRTSLGRDLSGAAANVTVNLIQPETLYAARRNNVDMRVAKIFRYGRTRTQVGIDIYNLTNTDVVTSYNQTFRPGGSWLTPTGIRPARYVKVGAVLDF